MKGNKQRKLHFHFKVPKVEHSHKVCSLVFYFNYVIPGKKLFFIDILLFNFIWLRFIFSIFDTNNEYQISVAS